MEDSFDLQNFEEIRDGLEAHARRLVRRYSRISRECSPEDLVQETLVRYAAELDGGKTVDHPKSYLHRTLNNYVLSRIRKFKHELSVEERPVEGVPFTESLGVEDVREHGRAWRRQADRVHEVWPAGCRARVNYFAVLLVVLRQNTLICLAKTLVGEGTRQHIGDIREIVETLYPWGEEVHAGFKSDWPALSEVWAALWQTFIDDPDVASPGTVPKVLGGLGGEDTGVSGTTWYKWSQRSRDYLLESFEELGIDDSERAPLWKNIRLRSE